MTLHLSRLDITRDPAVATLGALLDPAGRGRGLDAHHRLIWSAFATDPDASRDFLWRAEGKGRFLVLSARPPVASPFFDPPAVQDFAPDLRAGDRLAFALRVNATRTEKTGGLSAGGREKKRHVDLVMDGLPPPGPGRAGARMAVAQKVAEGWLAGQGARAGFRPDKVVAGDYSVAQIPRERGKPLRFGILDLEGLLTVTEPAAFLAALAHGFGRAKAFGCGLMLIRRA
ncbi:MAG: type I-E CRISPR-associated protein Cas6/Cse3/CasE [Proteobacteria bacterium]|nr:type I-E CRISPR-associated protein Cas6/Cse3/CasE [Pseudomonadota bacterium]